MALFDDVLSGGNWMTGLASGVEAVVVLPLAAPILRPLAKPSETLSSRIGGLHRLPGGVFRYLRGPCLDTFSLRCMTSRAQRGSRSAALALQRFQPEASVRSAPLCGFGDLDLCAT